jgi:hypothetical protein
MQFKNPTSTVILFLFPSSGLDSALSSSFAVFVVTDCCCFAIQNIKAVFDAAIKVLEEEEEGMHHFVTILYLYKR